MAFRNWGLGFRVWGLGFGVKGLAFRVRGLAPLEWSATRTPTAVSRQ